MIKRILLLGISVVLVACGGDDDDGTGPDEYPAIDTVFTPTLQDFSPSTLYIRKGGTVVFSIFGYDHNAIFEQKPGAPQDIPATTNRNVSRVFPVVGTFPYECRLHPGMNGEIIVK
jgi:plastocyanin